MGGKKLSEIDRAMIAKVLHDAEKAGKSVATVRNIRALASGVFGKAVEWGFLDYNPAQGVKVAGKKVSRDRFLQADELPRFFAAVAEEDPAMRDFILLALLTGARRANLCAMHWRELDLSAGVWRIPRTKNDEPQSVTLCPEAVAILEARRHATGGGFVFPGTGRTGHIVEPKKAVERVMARAGIPYGRDVPNGVTLHDLRRTLGSWQARTGASLAIIGKSLNHKSPQATAIYARLDLDPVRQSVNTATSAMLEAAGLKDKADVVALQPAVVHILAGTNDIAGNGGPTSIAAITDNLRAMVELARANGIRVALGTVPPARAFNWRPEVRPVAAITALNQWIRTYAIQQKLALADYHAALDDGAGGIALEYAEDGVHPTAAGYALMEKLAEQALAEARRQPRYRLSR